MRRALVSLPDGVWNVIDKELKGTIGDGDSEVIRNVVISYLNEKGYLLKPKGKIAPQTDQTNRSDSKRARRTRRHDGGNGGNPRRKGNF
jgi:hypothetical protein